jgi:hypothetical protein
MPAPAVVGRPRRWIRSLLVLLLLLPLSPSFVCVPPPGAPACATDRPPADGWPSEGGGGEPQHGWAPGAAPDPQAAVDGPDAAK